MNTAPAPPAPISSLLATAKQAAEEAGKAILEIYETADFGVEAKADNSPLTKADTAAHHLIAQALSATGLPLLSEEGKEIPLEERKNWPFYWLVDPLDGTKEFIKRNGEFTVNIALMQHNIPVAGVVYAPCHKVLYYGSKGTGVFKETPAGTTLLTPLPQKESLASLLQKPEVRVIASRSHQTEETATFVRQFQNPMFSSMGSSLKFMLLAEGKADVYPRFAPTMEWDTAASHALLNALNRSIYGTDLSQELVYNKPNLQNPSFVSF